ncbi:MAG TPA: type II secretion system protein [Blastocatellia bacterium]
MLTGTLTECSRNAQRGERGWAMLGLLLALTIMSVVMASAIVPNVTKQVQRDKEEELYFRGRQMAEALARYYGNGFLRPMQLLVPPAYGYLTELDKLSEGVTLGVREIRFVRGSAMLDPMSGIEWEPVRARDPRVYNALQALSTSQPIPQSYWLLARAPEKLIRLTPSEDSKPATPQPSPPASGTPGAPVTPGAPANPAAPGAPGQPGQVIVKPPANPNTDDDDDDDDDEDDEDDDDLEGNDPLAHIFGSGSPGRTNIPIIGVAPRVKGKAIKPLYGYLENYEDWVFIYVPLPNATIPGQRPRNPAENQPGTERPRIGN